MVTARIVALSFVLVVAVARATPAADPPPPPDAATLNKLSARLAPVDLTVDVQRCRRTSGPRWSSCSPPRRSWTVSSCARPGRGTTRCCWIWCAIGRRWARRGCTPSCRTRGRGCASTGIGRSSAASVRSRPRPTSIPRTRPRPRSRPGCTPCPRRRARRPRDSSRRSDGRPTASCRRSHTASNTRASSSAPPRACATPPRLTQQPTLRAFLEARAAAFRSNDYYDSDVAWMKLDASIEPTIGPYEIVRGRLVRRQGGVRGVHLRARRRRDREAGQAGRRAAGDREQPPDRRQAAQPEAGRGGADSRRQPALRRGRRQQGGDDGRLQPAERRTHHQGGRQQAHDAEERAAREVRQGADADQPDRARPRATVPRCRSTRSSRTS